MKRRLRVGIIGSTKRGGRGHGMDTAFKDAGRFEFVAIADDDAEGLAATGKRKVARGILLPHAGDGEAAGK